MEGLHKICVSKSVIIKTKKSIIKMLRGEM